MTVCAKRAILEQFTKENGFTSRKHRTIICFITLLLSQAQFGSWEQIARHEKKSIIQTSVLCDRLTKDSHFQEQNETFICKMLVHLPLLTDGKGEYSNSLSNVSFFFFSERNWKYLKHDLEYHFIVFLSHWLSEICLSNQCVVLLSGFDIFRVEEGTIHFKHEIGSGIFNSRR